jgi:hypothetical protein
VNAEAPLQVSAETLRALHPNEVCVCLYVSHCACVLHAVVCPADLQVFVRRWSNPALPVQFFKNMIPDLLITLCKRCNRFFHSVFMCLLGDVAITHGIDGFDWYAQDDLELEVLKKKACPFCRCGEAEIGLP